MSIRKFEEFVGYGADEMDSKEWPSAAKAKYEIDSEKKFTKKDLMDAAYAFTDDAAKVENGFEDWYEKRYSLMRKFTAKFESRMITDIPESFQDVVDLMENQKEYGNGCTNLTVGRGYCLKHDLTKYGKAQSISVKNFKKMKELFPNGEISDKWLLCVKAVFRYEPIFGSTEIPNLQNWDENRLWTSNDLEILANRINSFKTLIKRLERYCRHVVITPIGNGFEGTNTGESVCVLAILEQ